MIYRPGKWKSTDPDFATCTYVQDDPLVEFLSNYHNERLKAVLISNTNDSTSSRTTSSRYDSSVSKPKSRKSRDRALPGRADGRSPAPQRSFPSGQSST